MKTKVYILVLVGVIIFSHLSAAQATDQFVQSETGDLPEIGIEESRSQLEHVIKNAVAGLGQVASQYVEVAEQMDSCALLESDQQVGCEIDALEAYQRANKQETQKVREIQAGLGTVVEAIDRSIERNTKYRKGFETDTATFERRLTQFVPRIERFQQLLTQTEGRVEQQVLKAMMKLRSDYLSIQHRRDRAQAALGGLAARHADLTLARQLVESRRDATDIALNALQNRREEAEYEQRVAAATASSPGLSAAVAALTGVDAIDRSLTSAIERGPVRSTTATGRDHRLSEQGPNGLSGADVIRWFESFES